MTGTTFPVTINSQMEINALYDTGATRSTLFSIQGWTWKINQPLHVRTVSGTDMGAIGFTMLKFAINNHVFTQQFIACRSQT